MKVGLRGDKIIVVRPEHAHGPPSYLPGRPRTYVCRRAGDPCRVYGTRRSTAVPEGRKRVLVPDLSNVSKPATAKLAGHGWNGEFDRKLPGRIPGVSRIQNRVFG